MLNRNVKYSKEMRDRARKDGRFLATVDIPGFTFQGPVSKEHCKEALEMITRWIKEENEDD